jgi:glycosyltransferase involved in cell wall biosynthesis
MKVALVHDWLVSIRGAEKVLESFCRLYPEADVFTLRHDASGVRASAELAERAVHTSFIDRVPRAVSAGRVGFRLLLPLFPMAIESFRLDGYDLVISSHHAVAKGVLAPPGALHVSYVHSPMRYIWEAGGEYAPSVPGGALGRAAFGALAHYLRLWDTASTSRVDALCANSRYTRDRIQRCYGRASEIIEPPVDVARFERIPDPRPPAASSNGAPMYLCVSALVPYKRVELAVRAFLGRPERLVVVGEGPEQARLAGLAAGAPNIELRGRVDDAAVDQLFAECQAVIHPAIDDFGIVPVEALATGRPVVAFAGGGATDSVRDGETGVLFAEATPASLGAAVTRLGGLRFDPARLRAEARRFDRAAFERRFAAFVDACWRAREARAAAPA